MKTLKMLLICMICIPLVMTAQEEEDSKYGMIEVTYMKPAKGMAKKMEEAIEKHNAKYHSEAPYQSRLWHIMSGNEAGWYVWTMGPLTFTDMDGAPGPGEHMADWNKNVDQYVSEYGRTEYWKHNDKMSVTDDDMEDWQVTWFMEIEWGQYYRFMNFLEDLHEIQAESGEEMHVWMNEMTQNDGRDVAFTWPFDKWADLDKDDFNMMEAYNKEHGPMGWSNAMKEWEDFNHRMQQEIWRRVK